MNKNSLYQELSKTLNQDPRDQKIKLAMEYLDQAAQILDNMQAYQASEAVVKIMERISKNS